jgi:cytochrome c-type biogenesis protein CcmH
MAIFVSCAALMIAAALAFVLVPLMRHRRAATADPTARRLRALDEALAAGVIDASEHASKRAQIAQSSITSAPAPSRTAFVALLLVALLLPASALLLYRIVGAPQALDPAVLAAAAAPEQGPDMEQAINALAAKLKQQPDDAEGWALLGRAYQATGRANESLDAFRHAHELAKDDVAVTVEFAQALAVVAPNHRIDGEARELLEGVLTKDAENQRALWLLGISEYQNGRYDAAIARWNTLLPLLGANADVVASVKQQIAEAEARRDGRELPAPAASQTRQGIAAEAAPTTTGKSDGPRLTVSVAIDAKLAQQVDPDATLFVFARAASGPPMPLAIQRLKAAQLPLTVTLDESMGMLPNMKLSMFPQVVIGARISKSGNAMPQSGDLQTLSKPVDVHRTEPLALTIDQQVP